MVDPFKDLSPLSPQQRKQIDSDLTYVYSPWKEKLPYFFPTAPEEFYEEPTPAMLYLLSKAFKISLPASTEKDKKQYEKSLDEKIEELMKQLSDLAGEGEGDGEGDSGEGEGEGDGGGAGSGDSGEGEGEGSGEGSQLDPLEASELDGEGESGGSGKYILAEKLTEQLNKLRFEKSLVSNQGTTKTQLPEGRAELFTVRYRDGYEGYQQVLFDHEEIQPTVDFQLYTLFKKILTAESRDKLRWGKEEGELDPERFVDIIQRGATDLFGQYSPGMRRKPAFVIALDHSGSMGGYTDRLQAIAAVNIIEALERLKVPNCILTFGDHNLVLREFGDSSPWRPPKGFTGYEHPQHSYKYGVQLLSERRETRKILLLLSDGAVWPEQTRGARELALRYGIECYLFCIGWKPEGATLRAIEKVYDGVAFWVRESGSSAEASFTESLYHYMEQLFTTVIDRPDIKLR